MRAGHGTELAINQKPSATVTSRCYDVRYRDVSGQHRLPLPAVSPSLAPVTLSVDLDELCTRHGTTKRHIRRLYSKRDVTGRQRMAVTWLIGDGEHVNDRGGGRGG